MLYVRNSSYSLLLRKPFLRADVFQVSTNTVWTKKFKEIKFSSNNTRSTKEREMFEDLA